MVNPRNILLPVIIGGAIASLATFGNSTTSIRPEDVNHDGLVDIVLTNGFGRENVCLQRKDGTYELPTNKSYIKEEPRNAEQEISPQFEDVHPFERNDYHIPEEEVGRSDYETSKSCR